MTALVNFSGMNIVRSVLPVEKPRTLRRLILVLVGCITGELVLSCFLSQWVLLYINFVKLECILFFHVYLWHIGEADHLSVCMLDKSS